MNVIELIINKRHKVDVELIEKHELKLIQKSVFFFDWNKEQDNEVYKLILNDEILGLMSCVDYETESRIEIKLLSVSKENRGKNKRYDRIAGTLIGYACRESIKRYAEFGGVSLLPKTRLKQHYIEKYGMLTAGKHVLLQGESLLRILNEYEL